MRTHAHHHHFGVMSKASQIFVAIGSILQHKKLNIRLNKRDKGHGIMWKDGINLLAGLRIGAGQLHVGIVVHDVTTLCREVFGQMSTYIYVIGRLVGVGHHVNLVFIRAVAYHYGRVFASDVGHRPGRTAFGSGVVEPFCHLGRYR